MTKKKIIYWLPRILSLIIVLFFAVFILEGFGPGFSWQDSLAHFLTALIVLGITIIAWKKPELGGWIFIVVGILFGLFFHSPWWNGLLIGGGPIIIGILFLLADPKESLKKV